ncbi:mitochondrial ATPase inhibitor, IATP-domain-containing protein [Aspergillus coremiiformis]|uniref:ATPase inhibitor, mitochondrial n=1 Tax=Aspergillus coremiiformis TaxID=138285 RepID=A0A5N6Z1A1_9EURO|nr:mitochondrial ATPase inhibitor, IATP-domain-containing protein [Aspergillus coremiiformis]
MLRQSIRPITTANRAIVSRSFSALAPKMGEGDTGAPRAGGAAQSDQFTKREAAQENLYIHEKEREKLLALRKKVQEQREHLDELDKHIEDLTKNQGGEQN